MGNHKMGKARVHLIISGIVQGVFFRSTSRSQALHLGLTGWVKNRADGKVEIVAEGEQDVLDRFIQWCHEGPPGSRVDKVNLEFDEYTGEFFNFAIKYIDSW